MRRYPPSLLEKIQLPYLIHKSMGSAGILVTDLLNNTVSDCKLCEELAKQNPFSAYNYTGKKCVFKTL